MSYARKISLLGALVLSLALGGIFAVSNPVVAGGQAGWNGSYEAVENFKQPAIGPFNGVPVKAMSPGQTCDPGVLCVWQHRDRGGQWWDMTYPAGGYRSLEGSWWNNRISSVQNRTGRTILLIGNVACHRENQGGYVLEIKNGWYFSNLAYYDGGYPNDAISCVDWR